MENPELIVEVPVENQEVAPEEPLSKKAKRVRLSKGAKHAAAVYDRYSKKTVKELRAELKEKGAQIPLSRLSKAMLIAMLEEQNREKKIKKKQKVDTGMVL